MENILYVTLQRQWSNIHMSFTGFVSCCRDYRRTMWGLTFTWAFSGRVADQQSKELIATVEKLPKNTADHPIQEVVVESCGVEA